MEHVPSGNFNANAAWLVCAVLATTSSGGRPCSGRSPPKTNWSWPAPSGPGSSPSLAAWSIDRVDRHCEPRWNGPGPRHFVGHSTCCGHCPRFRCSQPPRAAHRRRRQNGADNRNGSQPLGRARPHCHCRVASTVHCTSGRPLTPKWLQSKSGSVDPGLVLLLRTPDMDDGQRKPLGLLGHLVTEDLTA